MAINLFLQPLADSNISYEYKTNVLATYNNLEDRIAQRDVPRITFNYSYFLSDYKNAHALKTELENNSAVGTVWLPDWFGAINVVDIVAGVNTKQISKYFNFSKDQYILVYAGDNDYEVTQLTKCDSHTNYGEIAFETTKSFSSAFIMPLYDCDMVNDNISDSINTLSNSFKITMMAKKPPLPNIVSHDVTFLGHDVLCDNFKIFIDNSNEVSSSQTVQENDYEIGIRDRFTFFDRMYNSFSISLFVEQNRLEYTRNFVKRRWGMTYACFVPSTSNDFCKIEQSGVITSVIKIKRTDFDFEARPYIAITHGNSITYAKVINVVTEDNACNLALDSSTMTTVVLDENDNVVSTSITSELNCYTSDITSIQTLYFARLSDDGINFEYVGCSDDYDNVYKIEFPFIETEFYDSSLVDYNNVDARDIDKLTLFEVKSFDTSLMNNDVSDSHVTTAYHGTATEYASTITGKYNGTYAFNYIDIIDKKRYSSQAGSSGMYIDKYLVEPNQDFCIQVEGKFDNVDSNTNGSLSYLAKSAGSGFSIELLRVNDSTDMYVCLCPFASNNGEHPTSSDNIRISKYDGSLSDWHEFGIQRINGITYVYCDGYLNGSSTVWENSYLFKGFVRSYSNIITYIYLGKTSSYDGSGYNTDYISHVQQARLTFDRHVYTGTTMSKSNRIYYLNDYDLTETVPMDSATIVKYDFKSKSSFGRWYLKYAYQNNNNVNLYACGLAQHPYARYKPCVVDNINDTARYSSITIGNFYSSVNPKLNLANNDFYLPYHKYKMPVKWYKDLWMEFDFVKNGSIENETIVLKADGIMLTAYVNADESKWSFGAFGLNPVTQELDMFDTSDHINVVIFVDSKYNRAGLYINGELYISDTITNIVTHTEHGCIGFMPFYMGGVNIDMYKFRLVDLCLTHDDNYNVKDSWTLGYRTTYFDFEFGKKQTDVYPTLRIVNIDNVYPLSDIYGVIKNENYISRYSFYWSDGSYGPSVVNPQGNTLYTVEVTDNVTGVKGYGWFYVYANYTGEVCRSDFHLSTSYDDNGNPIQTNFIDGVRYNFLTKSYETYNPTYLRNSFTLEKTNGGGVQLVQSGNAISFLDFLGSSGAINNISSYAYMWHCYHRWFLESYVKQLEFVVTLKNFDTTYFYTSGTQAYYRSYNISTLQFRGAWDYNTETGTSFRTSYLDYYNSDGQTPEYTQHTTSYYNLNNCCTGVYIYHSPKYTMNYQQGITYQGVYVGRYDSQGYWGSGTSNLPDCAYTLYDTTPPKPLHIVLEPVVVAVPVGGSYSAGKFCVLFKNIWVDGKKCDMLQLSKKMTIAYGSMKNALPKDYKNYTTSLLDTALLTLIMPQITEDYTNGKEWFEKKIAGIGGNFNIGYSSFLLGIADVKIYDYIKYTSDFDASGIIKKYS